MKNKKNSTEKFNFRKLNDEIANKTIWAMPVYKKSSSPLRLKKMSTTKVVLKTPVLTLFPPILFTLIGSFVAIVFYDSFQEEFGDLSILIALAFGGVFIFFGIQTLISYFRSASFNKQTGNFLKGKYKCKITEIHALQLIHDNNNTKRNEANYSGRGGVLELNLILKNSSRQYLLTSSSYKKVRSDAQQLADFLDIPLWDATINNS